MAAAAARKIDPDQARAGFRPGLYRHHKGGLYLATALVEDEDAGTTRVVYRSIAYGKDYTRPLTSEAGEAWSDHVEWPRLPNHPRGRRGWPYGSWAPRYTLVAPFRFLLLIGGPPGEGAGEALVLAQEIENVEASSLVADEKRTIAILQSALRVPVVPVWVSNVEHEPPEKHVRLINGSRDFLLGQVCGILACVDPAVVVETTGPPVVPSPD